MFASTAESSNCFKYVTETLSGNTSAGIQFEPFMNTGNPLILKKNDLPEIETAHTHKHISYHIIYSYERAVDNNTNANNKSI